VPVDDLGHVPHGLNLHEITVTRGVAAATRSAVRPR
jgi:hypothetical protein